MEPNNDQLAVLRRLQSDGQISDEEFANLVRGLTGTEPEPAGTDTEPAHAKPEPADTEPELADHEPSGTHRWRDDPMERERVADASPDAPEESDDDMEHDAASEEERGSADALLTPKFRQNLSVNYLGIVFIASMTLLTVGLLGVISWWVCIPSVLVLVSTLFEGWGKVTLGGAVAVAVILPISLFVSAGDPPEPEQTPTVTVPPQDPYPPIPGSLSVYMGQVIDRWNTVDGPPRINRGLTRHNEVGEYDTFIYRFGDWGRLAGAYDAGNDAIYALLITGTFSAEDTDQLYLHLCYVTAPFSQDCIDAYHEEGLDGGALEDFTDISHEAEWTVGEGTWRLQIEQNVMTIRVYGPDAA
jgi:hypothetical protein